MAAAAATFVLQRAASSYVQGGRRPSSETVTQALVALEKQQKRNKAIIDGEKLYGQWRLIYTADTRSKVPWANLYFPLRAQQTFLRDDGGVFDNGIFWFNGAVNFRVRGPMRWVSERNRMEFSVDRASVKVGEWRWKKDGLDTEGYSIEGRTAKTLPFFTFFLIRDDIAAARGRSGGLALYSKVKGGDSL